jgi:hypothetical protein
MAWHSLRGINLACWRTLFEKKFYWKNEPISPKIRHNLTRKTSWMVNLFSSNIACGYVFCSNLNNSNLWLITIAKLPYQLLLSTLSFWIQKPARPLDGNFFESHYSQKTFAGMRTRDKLFDTRGPFSLTVEQPRSRSKPCWLLRIVISGTTNYCNFLHGKLGNLLVKICLFVCLFVCLWGTQVSR